MCALGSDPIDCSIGDVGSRHGLITTGSYEATFSDSNIPLFGTRSIVSRTLALTTASGVIVSCANAVLSHDAGVTRLRASLGGHGLVEMSQVSHDPSVRTFPFLSL